MEQRLAAMFQAVQTVEPVLEKFYGSLSDEQKKRFPSRPTSTVTPKSANAASPAASANEKSIAGKH